MLKGEKKIQKKSDLQKESETCEVKRVMLAKQPLDLLSYKHPMLSANIFVHHDLSSSVTSILQDFQALDLRTNPFQEGENDENAIHDKGLKALGRHGVPMARTRARTKKAKEKPKKDQIATPIRVV